MVFSSTLSSILATTLLNMNSLLNETLIPNTDSDFDSDTELGNGSGPDLTISPIDSIAVNIISESRLLKNDTTQYRK